MSPRFLGASLAPFILLIYIRLEVIAYLAPMPVIASGFRPPPWLRNGHLQTVLAAARRPRLRQAVTRERLELDDGDFLDLAWVRSHSSTAPTVVNRGRRHLAILCHGLEGSAEAGYVRGMTGALVAAGWDVLAWTFRGCGPEPNRLPRFYHSGETGDLRAVVRHAVAGTEASEGCPAVVLVGFSLGGNVVLKYLGEKKAAPSSPHPAVVGAVAVSVPVDLAASARALDERWVNGVYLRRFLRTLRAKVAAKAQVFPDEFDVTGLRRVTRFGQFDDRYTARLHGFRDAADYWSRSSARQFLPGIAVPTLLINARDDPFLPAPACFPWSEAAASAHLFFEAPACGGHVGFVDAFPCVNDDRQTWAERRAVEFLKALV